MYRVVIPETENGQEAKSVYPGTPVWHAQADPGRELYAESTMLIFSWDGLHIDYCKATPLKIEDIARGN